MLLRGGRSPKKVSDALRKSLMQLHVFFRSFFNFDLSGQQHNKILASPALASSRHDDNRPLNRFIDACCYFYLHLSGKYIRFFINPENWLSHVSCLSKKSSLASQKSAFDSVSSNMPESVKIVCLTGIFIFLLHPRFCHENLSSYVVRKLNQSHIVVFYFSLTLSPVCAKKVGKTLAI